MKAQAPTRTFGRDYMNDFVALTAPREATGVARRRTFDQNLQLLADQRLQVRSLLALDHREQACQTVVLHVFGHFVTELERRSVRPR